MIWGIIALVIVVLNAWIIGGNIWDLIKDWGKK